MECYSAKKKKRSEVLIDATRWVSFDNVVLSDSRQSQKPPSPQRALLLPGAGSLGGWAWPLTGTQSPLGDEMLVNVNAVTRCTNL